VKRPATVTPIGGELSDLDKALHSLGAAGLLPRISELTVGPIKVTLHGAPPKQETEPKRMSQEEHDAILYGSAEGGL
jgi:hypothetical protein